MSTLGIMIEKTNEWKSPFGVLCLDIKKAYDHVCRAQLLHELSALVPAHVLLVYAHIFNCSALLQWEVLRSTQGIPVTRGCPHGDPSSPALFALLTAAILAPLLHDWTSRGLVTWGFPEWDNQLLHLALFIYADDLLLPARDSETMLVLLEDIQWALAAVGLSVNHTKSALAANPSWEARFGTSFSARSCSLDTCSEIKVLGTVLSMNGRWDQAVLHSIRKAHIALHKGAMQLRHRQASFKIRMRLLDMLVGSVLLFGSECWILSKNLASRVERFHLACIVYTLRPKRRSSESWLEWFRRTIHLARVLRRRVAQQPWLEKLPP